jgi:hypothetical protein
LKQTNTSASYVIKNLDYFTVCIMPDAINKTIFSFNIFVLWSQLADKLTIEVILCSWILYADHFSKSPLTFATISGLSFPRILFHALIQANGA